MNQTIEIQQRCTKIVFCYKYQRKFVKYRCLNTEIFYRFNKNALIITKISFRQIQLSMTHFRYCVLNKGLIHLKSFIQ